MNLFNNIDKQFNNNNVNKIIELCELFEPFLKDSEINYNDLSKSDLYISDFEYDNVLKGILELIQLTLIKRYKLLTYLTDVPIIFLNDNEIFLDYNIERNLVLINEIQLSKILKKRGIIFNREYLKKFVRMIAANTKLKIGIIYGTNS